MLVVYHFGRISNTSLAGSYLYSWVWRERERGGGLNPAILVFSSQIEDDPVLVRRLQMFCCCIDNNPNTPLFGRIAQSFRVKTALDQHVALRNILLKEPEIRNVSEVSWCVSDMRLLRN